MHLFDSAVQVNTPDEALSSCPFRRIVQPLRPAYDTQTLAVRRSFAWGISSVSEELIISPCSVYGDLQS